MSSKSYKPREPEPNPQGSHPAEFDGEYGRDQETGLPNRPPGGMVPWNAHREVKGGPLPTSTISTGSDRGWLGRFFGANQSQDQALEANPELEKMLGKLERKNERITQLREDLARRNGKITQLSEDLARRDQHMIQLSDRLARRDGKITQLGNDLARRDEHISQLGADLARRDEHITQLGDKLARRDGKIAQLSEELSEWKREVEDLKKTLSMYDECSEVEITAMMSGINTQIQSLGRNTAQRWLRGVSRAPEGGGNTFLNETEMETFKRIVGTQLADALGSPPPERSRCVVMLLPLAWQAAIVTVVMKILSSFVEGLPVSERGSVVDEELREVSELVKEGELQPAYGRWRFITHQYLKRRINHEEAVQSYVKEALGYCELAARLALKSACPDNQTLINDLQAQMTEIMEEAFKLRTNIQEKKVTANYDAYLPLNGTPFQSDLMEVAKEDEEHSDDTVVCTTRLGMICFRKRGRENASDLTKEVALKPQVLTDQNLGDIIS